MSQIPPNLPLSKFPALKLTLHKQPCEASICLQQTNLTLSFDYASHAHIKLDSKQYILEIDLERL